MSPWHVPLEALRILARSKVRALLLLCASGLFWFVVCQLLLLWGSSGSLSSGVFRQVPADLYLFRDTEPADLERLRATVDSLSEIEWGRLITPQDAAADFLRAFGEDPEELLGENPFPMSVELRLRLGGDRPRMEEQLRFLAFQPAVEELQYSRGLLDKVSGRLRQGTFILLALLLLLLVGVLLLQRMAWASQLRAWRPEMETLARLGAPPAEIRRPLLLLAVIQGLVPALAALACSLALVGLAAGIGLPLRAPLSLWWILLPAALWMPLVEWNRQEKQLRASYYDSGLFESRRSV